MQPAALISLSLQLPHNRAELIEIAILDVQRAFAAAVIKGHLEPECVGQPPLERACRRPSPRAPSASAARHSRLTSRACHTVLA
jgi:hypothetical protein